MAAMGAWQSSSAHAEGSVNGNPVTFYYKKADTADQSSLSWTEGYKEQREDPSSQWTSIPAQDIIAVSNPRTGDHTGSLYLMYVQDNTTAATGESTVSPKVFRYLEVRNVPTSLINDFQITPPNATCLYLRYDRDEGSLNSHIIISTASGTGRALAVWEQLVQPMLNLVDMKEGVDFALHITSSETSVSEFTKEILLPRANLGISQTVMILCGDGGVVDILNGLLEGQQHQGSYRKPSIALLPLGTGNALAHSTGITADNTLGLRTWINGKVRELPYFCARFSPGARALFDEAREARPLGVRDGGSVPTAYGVVVCSWAFHAALVADSDTAEYRKYGAERFKMAAKENLYPPDGLPPHMYRGRLKTLISRESGDYWSDIPRTEHMYVLATPVSTLEEGFTISPASKPLDGKLRLVHFGAMSAEQAMTVMGGAYAGGKHVEDENVGYEEIDGLRIDFDEDDPRWRRICIDGKIIRVEQGGYVEIKGGLTGVLDLVCLE